MSDRIRRTLGVVVAVAAAVVIAVGLSSGTGAGDRADALAARLKCPVCESETVAQSATEVARNMRRDIAEQVAAGRTDAEIIEFYVARFGDTILLDPPARGRNLVLWIAPALMLAAGLAAIAMLRRRPGAAPATDAAVATRDLADVAVQEAGGELDAATAARLRAIYETELGSGPGSGTAAPTAAPRWSRGRLAAGAAVLLLGAGALTWLVAGALEPRPPGGLVTGGIAGDVAAGGRDLAGVTDEELEAVVAANPDVPGMRAALARRYFNAGRFSDALRHYLVILEQGPTAEALANVGWMAFINGEADAASGYFAAALRADPGYLPTYWFRANARYSAGDGPGAVADLTVLLAEPDVPSDIREQAESLLAAARELAP